MTGLPPSNTRASVSGKKNNRRDGYLFYDNMPMDEILEDIGKYYNMSVKCLNPNIHAYRLRFMVKRNEPIKDAIDALNMMQKVKVTLKNENIIVVE